MTPYQERAYIIGLRMAHDSARESIRMAQKQPRFRDFWLSEAKRHYERARWYLTWIRRGF